jgi:hypothetical protein
MTSLAHEDDAMMNDAMTMTEDDAEFLLEEDMSEIHQSFRQVSDSTGEHSSNNDNDNDNDNDDSVPVVITPTPVMTGRPPILLYLSCNPDHLSEYQCLIRKHIELFEANHSEVQGRIKGRNKPIVLGQVGIRCRYCAHLTPPHTRARGAMYYSHKLAGIYQSAQILSQGHLLELCPFVPAELREEMKTLKAKKVSAATSGKEYWAATAKVLGVYEDQYGLRFEERLGIVRH